jgi:uncharacterized protein YjiS (DUF1127 family)
MKLINLGIASIVDANTGNGISRQFIGQSGSKDSDYEKSAREIRAKSVLGVLAKIKSAFKQYLDESRAAARARRNTAALSQLCEHLLKDIGLTFVDIQDLKSGQITLEELNARRVQYRDQAASIKHLDLASKQVGTRVLDLDSASQEQYEIAKCA